MGESKIREQLATDDLASPMSFVPAWMLSLRQVSIDDLEVHGSDRCGESQALTPPTLSCFGPAAELPTNVHAVSCRGA
jgi:hypothetical protein